MDGDSKTAQNFKETTQQEGNPTSPQEVQRSREEILEEIRIFFEKLFDPNNIVNNSYLAQRAINEYFEIPIQYIYGERNVKAITQDKEIIHEALENTPNVVIHKKKDIVSSVSLKNFKLEKKVIIKNITADKFDAFKQFVNQLDEGTNEKIANWSYNAQLNLVSIICLDEASASQIHERLTASKFEENVIECSLATESLYISSMENLKNKHKGFKNPLNSMYQMNMMMNMNQLYPYGAYPNFNPYAMNAFYGNMANYYGAGGYQSSGHFPVSGKNDRSNYTRQNGGYQKNYNQNYKNDKKSFAKRLKQPRDNNYKNNKQTKSSFVVRDNEFPPL